MGRVYGTKHAIATQEAFRWKYADNPFGETRFCVAETADRYIACVGAMPILFRQGMAPMRCFFFWTWRPTLSFAATGYSGRPQRLS
jgi:hypothetical protein